MARKIKAKTLVELVSRFVDEFPEEAADRVADADGRDGAELLEYLTADRALRVLRLLPEETCGRWLNLCEDETLIRLVRQTNPDARIEDEPRDSLEDQVLSGLTGASR